MTDRERSEAEEGGAQPPTCAGLCSVHAVPGLGVLRREFVPPAHNGPKRLGARNAFSGALGGNC